MYKKVMEYEDFNGEKRKEEFLFNLTKAELIEMEFIGEGGLAKTIEAISKTHDKEKLIEIFKKLILKAYGEKSIDGKYFRKNDEIRSNFESTQAYSDFFILLASDDEEAIKFLNGIMPSDLNITKEDIEKAKLDFELV